MTDEATHNEPEVTTPEIPDNLESVDRTELEQLRANAARLTQLEADLSDFDSVEDYVAALEEEINKRDSKPKAPVTPTPPKTPPPAQDKTDMSQIATAVIRSDWVEYRLDQKELPEDQRSNWTKQELLEVLYKQPALVGQVASENDGNLIAAARLVLDTTKGTVAKKVAEARKEGAGSEAAKLAAAASANLPTGGATTPPKEETPEERAAEQKKAVLDSMLPDDPPQSFD